MTENLGQDYNNLLKQNKEIIDGCNVAECEFYDIGRSKTDKYCNCDGNMSIYCEGNPNCYFKQLKSEKGANESANKKLIKLSDELAGVKAKNEELISQLDFMVQKTEVVEQKNEELKKSLITSNEQLVQTFEKIDELEEKNKKDITNHKAMLDIYIDENKELKDKSKLYKFETALKDIREIALNNCKMTRCRYSNEEYCKDCDFYYADKQILTKINEVVDE